MDWFAGGVSGCEMMLGLVFEKLNLDLANTKPAIEFPLCCLRFNYNKARPVLSKLMNFEIGGILEKRNFFLRRIKNCRIPK